MAEANKSEECQCTSKWDFLQFGLEKGEDGKSNFVRLKGQPNAHLLLANQVLIQNFQFFRMFEIEPRNSVLRVNSQSFMVKGQNYCAKSQETQRKLELH